jgi:hypothetical protein
MFGGVSEVDQRRIHLEAKPRLHDSEREDPVKGESIVERVLGLENLFPDWSAVSLLILVAADLTPSLRRRRPCGH